MLVDSYDGATQAEEHGTIAYAPSLPTLGQAVDIEPGDWLKYAVPSWSGQQGTIEAWINPDQYGYSIALLQWNNTNTSPPAGYVGHFNISPDGYLEWGSWGPPFPAPPHPIGTTVVPLGEWTHVAVTWSPAGTHLYVNGELDYSTASNWAPFLLTTTYVYVNGWGSNDHGLMDELRISDVARSEEEISMYVQETMTVLVAVDVKPGSDPNCVNSNGHGAIPVAVLGSADFDATEIDPATVDVDGQTVRAVGAKGKLQAHLEDVDGDGLVDLVLQIEDLAGTYDENSALATLNGSTFGGVPVQGTDAICVVP